MTAVLCREMIPKELCFAGEQNLSLQSCLKGWEYLRSQDVFLFHFILGSRQKIVSCRYEMARAQVVLSHPECTHLHKWRTTANHWARTWQSHLWPESSHLTAASGTNCRKVFLPWLLSRIYFSLLLILCSLFKHLLCASIGTGSVISWEIPPSRKNCSY